MLRISAEFPGTIYTLAFCSILFFSSSCRKDEIRINIVFDDGEQAALTPLVIFQKNWYGKYTLIHSEPTHLSNDNPKNPISLSDHKGAIYLSGVDPSDVELYVHPTVYEYELTTPYLRYLESQTALVTSRVNATTYRATLPWDTMSYRLRSHEEGKLIGISMEWRFIPASNYSFESERATRLFYSNEIQSPLDLRIPFPHESGDPPDSDYTFQGFGFSFMSNFGHYNFHCGYPERIQDVLEFEITSDGAHLKRRP